VARIAAGDVDGGTHCDDVSGDCTMTWHADWVLTVYTGVMMTSSLSRSGTWVGSSDIRVESAHPGEEDACDAWSASVCVGNLHAGA
jgi:hypothetical protein